MSPNHSDPFINLSIRSSLGTVTIDQAHMGEIALDVYFSKKLSLFLQQLFSGTFCIGSIVSIISTADPVGKLCVENYNILEVA